MKWFLFHRVYCAALPAFHSKPDQTNQTLALDRDLVETRGVRVVARCSLTSKWHQIPQTGKNVLRHLSNVCLFDSSFWLSSTIKLIILIMSLQCDLFCWETLDPGIQCQLMRKKTQIWLRCGERACYLIYFVWNNFGLACMGFEWWSSHLTLTTSSSCCALFFMENKPTEHLYLESIFLCIHWSKPRTFSCHCSNTVLLLSVGFSKPL